jgi:molybdenum cofactor guanylyltransferase
MRPQVDTLLINANRSIERYRALGCPVIGDALDDFQGPLSGFASALAAAETPLVAIVPCDCPRLSPDLVSRLRGALTAADAEIAVAHDGERLQPVHALLRRELCADLLATLEDGERKIDRWYAMHAMVCVDFSDEPEVFRNVNAETDRLALEQEILARDAR